VADDKPFTLVATTRRTEEHADFVEPFTIDLSATWQSAVRSPSVIQIAHPQTDARVRHWPGVFSSETKELCLVPIIVGSAWVGAISIDFHHQERDSQERSELAHVLALQLGLFLQICDLARRERGAAITEERNRMAHDIHDSLAQALTGIVI